MCEITINEYFRFGIGRAVYFAAATTDAIIPRTWETCGLLRRRLLRYASSLTPIPLRSIPVRPGLRYARSAPNPTRLPDGPQTPAVFAPLTYRQGIYKTARTIASGIRPSAISSRSLKPLRQKTFPRVKLIKTAFTSPGTFPYYPASSASVTPRTSSHDILKRAVSNSLPPSHTAGPAPLQPPDSRHLRNIIRPLIV